MNTDLPSFYMAAEKNEELAANLLFDIQGVGQNSRSDFRIKKS